jgi:crotonobetainyl-CoA:carnitine CoA-transferase CaiB-like acyl-CoA transferase
MSGPLSRVRVLDMTRVLAGPWATQMLADLGADVIKVERPVLGDDTRHWGPPWIQDESGNATTDSAYFSSTNRNKRSVAIDLSTPSGQQLVKELAKKCDVLAENYKVGDLKRYGLSYEDLKAVNPRLIYCSVTGYGQDGPYAEKPGYDFIFQGEGGLMSINGESDDKPGGGPMKTSIAVTDVLTGLNATIAILAALEHSRHTGEGQHIDISLLDTIVHFGSNQVVSYFSSGEIPKRWGNAHPNLTPYQSFSTQDGHLIIACGNDGQFRKLCAALSQDQLAQDPRFVRMADRNIHRGPLISQLSAIFRQQTTAYWLKALEHSEVPNGGINTYDKVFEHPQVVARELKVKQQHATGGEVTTVRNPIRLSRTPIEYRYPPPQRAQHTQEVLSSVLELSPDQVAQLEIDKVIEIAKKGA